MATTHREGSVVEHDGPAPPAQTHTETPVGLRPAAESEPAPPAEPVAEPAPVAPPTPARAAKKKTATAAPKSARKAKRR